MKKVKEFQSGLVSKALVQHTRAVDSNPTKVLCQFFYFANKFSIYTCVQ